MTAKPQAEPALDADRLWARVETLSRMTLPDRPWTRRAFSPLFQQSRDWLRAEFEAAGLAVSLDAAGNLIGRREGSVPGLPPLMTGSHCDTVMDGGRFDGIIGVLSGIEVARALHESGIQLRHPLEVVDFLSEEPSDYGVSCVGSRGMAGVLESGMLSLTDASGETLSQGMRRIGANPDALQPRQPGDVAAFVELHIEQGPVLEHRALPIGSVTNIVGIRRELITVLGRPDHAGTTPMNIRKDALVGAAALIETSHRLASEMAGKPHYVVATIGRIAMTPNVPNAVPGMVELMLEVRSDNRAVLDSFPEQVMSEVQQRLQQLGLSLSTRFVSRSQPVPCAELVIQAVEDAAHALACESMRLPSGAGHDAAYVAALGPAGMIFIPCLNGRSHCPEEWTEPGQLHQGTRVLAKTLMLLDESLDTTSDSTPKKASQSIPASTPDRHGNQTGSGR